VSNFARRDDQGFYTWDGVKYASVTTILGCAPGQHLMAWYGKQAAMKCASHLIQAGIRELSPADKSLFDFCTGIVPRTITREAAVDEIMAWERNMRQAERYRDHKARIGSIVHHYIYRHALGLRVAKADRLNHLKGIAIEIGLLENPSEDMLTEIAVSADAYVLSADEWIEQAKPEWEMIGQEAVVVRRDRDGQDGYAGTTDCIFTIRKREYEQFYPWVWDGMKRKFAGDFKTSNSLAKSVQAQVEAYANADFIGLVATGQELEIPGSDGIAAIHIGPHRTASEVMDEYGALTSHTKQIGTKMYTWPRNPVTFEAFLGLCRWYNWEQSVPRPEQSAKKAEPKAPKPTKTDRRAVPFG
jgi:hypothetical protein